MNARRYELIIFDWDGTLMDSAARIVHCFERAYADAGALYPGTEAVRRIIGLGLNEAIEVLSPQADANVRRHVLEGYRSYFLGLDAESMSLFPGVRDGLADGTGQVAGRRHRQVAPRPRPCARPHWLGRIFRRHAVR
jgi:phosphoglycolate phosphatase